MLVKILVIDDSKTMRQYLKSILDKNLYEVIEAENGKEGYELYKNLRPEFVITDIFMPEMDGIELIRKLVEEFPEIKIIVISGGGLISELPYFNLCAKYGVIGCMKKPIHKDALLEMLKYPYTKI